MRIVLLVSAIMLTIAGCAAALTGIWFIAGEHPFHRDGYSEEMGMTKAQLQAINPQIVDWTMHVSDQVGSVSMGWGLFIVVLAWFGVRNGQKVAWYALWIGGAPTLLISSFGEITQFGAVRQSGSLCDMCSMRQAEVKQITGVDVRVFAVLVGVDDQDLRFANLDLNA